MQTLFVTLILCAAVAAAQTAPGQLAGAKSKTQPSSQGAGTTQATGQSPRQSTADWPRQTEPKSKSQIKVLKLWKEGQFPQVTILLLTPAQLDDFRRNPIEFINRQNPKIV